MAARPDPGGKLNWSTATMTTRPGVAAASSSRSFELKLFSIRSVSAAIAAVAGRSACAAA